MTTDIPQRRILGDWIASDRIAEWWDGGDLPRLVVKMPAGVEFSDDVAAMLENAYRRGYKDGFESGEQSARAKIRRALGL